MSEIKKAELHISAKAHPLVKIIALTVFNEKMNVADVCYQAGIDEASFRRWKAAERDPSLSNLEAVARVVGMRLVLKPIYEESKDEKRKNIKARRVANSTNT